MPNIWSFLNFRLGQRKPCVVKCLKNSISSYNYPLHSTHLSPSSILNILWLSFTKTLNWKSHISSLAKSASKKLSALCHLHQFFSPFQLLALYSCLIRPCMEYVSHVWGARHTELLKKVEWKAFCLIDSPPLIDCLQSLTPPQCCISCYLLPLFSC